MEFTNGFKVRAPLPQVWEFMLRTEEVAPCVPGAEITEKLDSTHFKGVMKVKLGAVQMNYRGELEMEPYVEEHKIVLRAKGSDVRGSGGASGTVTTWLVEGPDGETEVNIHSLVDVTGRVAQFGRGIMQDVANRQIRAFSACLEAKLVAQSDGPESSGVDETATPEATDSAVQSPAPGEPQAAVTGTERPAPQTGPPKSSGTADSPQQGGGRASQPQQAVELRVSQLVLDISRSRLAALLRAAADRLEPKT